MGAQIAAVTARLDADTKGLDAGLDRSVEKLSNVERQTHETERAIAELGEHGIGAVEALHESLAELAQGFSATVLAAAGIEKAVELVKDLAKEMLTNGAAAQMIGVQFRNAFGGSANEVGEWAEKTGEALGRSQDDMMKLATSARIMVGGLGVAGEEADSMSESLAKLAAQMSIARGVPLDQAMQALNAGMHGAGRGLYEFGIALNTATQDQKALQLGLGETYSKLTESQRALVNFSIMMEGAGKVSNDAAAATGTYANQVAVLKSSWEEMTAHLGAAALPALTSAASELNELVKSFDKLSTATKSWAIALSFGPLGQMAKQAQDIASRLEKLISGSSSKTPTGADQDRAMYAVADAQQAANEEATAKYQAHVDELNKEAADSKAAKDKREAEEIAGLKVYSAEQRKEAQKYAAELAKINAQKLKDFHDLVAQEEKADAARIRAAADVVAARKAADQDYINDAKQEMAEAQKHLSNAGMPGGSLVAIQQAQAAVDQAAEVVMAASTDALRHTQAQLDANNAEISADLTRIGKDADVERLRRDNIGLMKDLNREGLDLERFKEQNMERARVQLAMYQAGQGLGSAGDKLAGATQFGGMARDVAAASTGGPAAMLAAGGVDLLLASKGGKAAIAAADKIFMELADTLGKVVEPLVPVIEAVGRALGSVLGPLGEMLKTLGTGFAKTLQGALDPLEALMQPIGDLLSAVAPLIGPIQQLSGILGDVLNGLDPFMLALKLLAPALELVATVIHDIVEAIASVWNSIIGEIQNVIRGIASILPDKVGGNALRDFADSMGSLKIQVDAVTGAFARQRDQQNAETMAFVNSHGGTGQGGEWGQILDAMAAQAQTDMGAASSAASNLATAATAAATALTAVQQASVTKSQDQLKMQIDEAALAFAQTHGGSAATIAALTAQVAKDSQQVTSDNWKQAAEIAKAHGDYATYIADMARAAYTDASATNANTRATQALTSALTHTPTGFHDEGYIFDATAAGSGSGRGSRGDSHNYYGGITVVANDPAAFQKAMRAHQASKRRGPGNF